MKIVIIGAGAVGAYFGARLEQIGQDVTFLVREKRAEQLNHQGLIIKSTEGNYAIKSPNVIVNPSELNDIDLVLLSVKGQHLPETLETLKQLTSQGTKVLPLLNGVEHLSILQQELGEDAVLGGLCFIISTLNKQGDVIHSSNFHDLRFGALHPSQQDICEEFASTTHNANMNATLSEDIILEMWNKYMFITAFSGITTATDLAIGEIRQNPSTFKIVENILNDMKRLANAYKIALTDDHVKKAIDNILALADEATSSMHQDRRKGMTLEVEHLHGGALRLAERAGLVLPYVESIYGMIKPFENKPIG